MIDTLPMCVLHNHILPALDTYALITLSSTSRKMRVLVQRNQRWRDLMQQLFPVRYQEEYSSLRIQLFYYPYVNEMQNIKLNGKMLRVEDSMELCNSCIKTNIDSLLFVFFTAPVFKLAYGRITSSFHAGYCHLISEYIKSTILK